MNDQGARRNRPAAHARGTPWPSGDDPAEPSPAPATGPLIGPGTGGYRVLQGGTAPQRVLGPGSGPQPTLERTPVRGFPPLVYGQPQAPTPPEGFGAWHTPEAPPADRDAGSAADSGGQDDPVPPASISAGPGRGGQTAGGPRRRPSRVMWLAIAAVVILAGGAYAGYKYLYEPRVNAPVSSSLRLPTTAPGSPAFNKALGKWQHIGTRTEDPEPLTLAELYPPRFALNGSSYLRAAASLTKDCTLAVYGAQLQAALQSGHCTQVLRASYMSGDGTMMGTIGVANLSTASAAQQAGQATGAQQIIAPLSSQKGPTSKLGTGTGVVQAEIKGHYLILMWAEFTSLKSPSTAAQRRLLEQFVANLVTGSANIDLSTRMMGGRAAASS